MSIFRNNGIYVFIAAFPFVLLVRSAVSLKKWAFIYAGVLILSFTYSGIVSNVFHIESGDAREAMSAIIQPLARIYHSVPGELSDEEKEAGTAPLMLSRRPRNVLNGQGQPVLKTVDALVLRTMIHEYPPYILKGTYRNQIYDEDRDPNKAFYNSDHRFIDKPSSYQL